VDRCIVSPDNTIFRADKIAVETENIAVVICCFNDVNDLQDRGRLNELLRIRGRAIRQGVSLRYYQYRYRNTLL
jgi:hypothetical protein